MSIGRLQRSLSNGGGKISSLMMYQLYNTIHKIFFVPYPPYHKLGPFATNLCNRNHQQLHALGKQLLPPLVMIGSVGEIQAAPVEGYKRHVATENGHVEAAMVDDVTFPMLPEAAKVGICFETVAK